jgi:hypothetical protein
MKISPAKWMLIGVAAVLFAMSLAILQRTRSPTPTEPDVIGARGTRVRRANQRVTLPPEEADALPANIIERASGWSPDPVIVPAPKRGQEAGVVSHKFVPNQPPPPTEPPNPFMPSKQHLSQEDVRSGVDRVW